LRPILFDTSVYVGALRDPSLADLLVKRWRGKAAIWLSSVVAEELYAGAMPRDTSVVDRLVHDFDKADRILVPNLRDWIRAGNTLARLAEKYGYERIGQGRLTNDALIAMSAARLGITIITGNARDFARLAEFRPFQWQSAES
jgi:predicted nucleic acid-binding protein